MCTEDLLQPVSRIFDVESDVSSFKAIPRFLRIPIAQVTTDPLRRRHDLVDDFVQRDNECLARDTRTSVNVGCDFTVLLLLVEGQYVAERDIRMVNASESNLLTLRG